MPRIVFAEYRDKYAGVPYPFADTATLTDTTGEIKIPVGLFVDASFYVNDASYGLFLSAIDVSASSVTLTVRNKGTLAEYTGVFQSNSLIRFVDAQRKQVGVLVCADSNPAFLTSLPVGTWQFTEEATPISVRCLLPVLTTGVGSVRVKDASSYLTGDVYLIGHDGVVLTEEPIAEPNTTCIRIDVVGDPLFKTAACYDAGVYSPRYVRSVNGVQPDIYGNILLSAAQSESILRVNTTDSGIVISLAGIDD